MQQTRGLLARGVVILGYGPVTGFGEQGLLLFAHQATRVGADGEVIVSCTVRRFNRGLPTRWVVESASYARTLGQAAGVTRVELRPSST